MRLRALALALALSLGLTAGMEAKQKQGISRSKAAKQTAKRVRKAPMSHATRRASKQSKAAKVKPRKASRHHA
jgi:hypothetical protein